MKEWIVVLEAVATSGAIDPAAFGGVITALGDCAPTGLYAPERYAVQARVRAESAPEALFLWTSRWREASANLGLTNWDLVRVELLTPQEFDWECEHGLVAQGVPVAGSGPPDEVETDGESIEEKLLRTVFHDPVTGLVSNALFQDHIERALSRARRERSGHALLLVDIDDFASISATVGPEPARGVLVSTASQLGGVLRPGDTVARVGSGEFAVFLEDCSERTARQVASRIAEALTGVVLLAGREFYLSVSIGLVSSRDGQTADELMHEAHVALTEAKRRGGGRVEVSRYGLSSETRDSGTRRPGRGG